MKHTLLTLALAFALAGSFISTPANAQITQEALIHHTIQKNSVLHNEPPSLGRDFWFSFMSNYWGENLGGAYLAIYITSPVNTTAYIQYQDLQISIPITANQVATYNPPLSWELQSSGEQEIKGIHVWSNDADLVVYTMSHNNGASEGSYIIPTIGWGTDYVVAAYGSFYDSTGYENYDLPSMLAITAGEGVAGVTITPSCDCRQCWSGSSAGGPQATQVVFPEGVPITIILNRGEDMQLMPVQATGSTGFDLTGTIIHSSQPVGVSAGSMLTSIPSPFASPNRVEESIPPVRTWGNTYFSTAFEQAPGTPGDHDYARYLFISSQPNQMISGHNCGQGDFTECIINPQYGIYWDELEGAQEFYSNAPFLCVEYLNSSTYPDDIAGLGNPAEAFLNSRQQFTKTVTFETPVLADGQYPVPYYNYANIVVNVKDANKTLFDGQRISNHPAQCIDGEWEMIPITDISAGAHLVDGDDSGVGVYVYGYGYDEAYAWSTPSGVGTFHSFDTVPPRVDTFAECYEGSVFVTDSGLLPNDSAQSGLAEVAVDSDYNMTYISDPNFIPGSVEPGSGYSMYVTDITKPAILIIDVCDIAGNETIITSTYLPSFDSIKPSLQNLGVWLPGNPPQVAYDTLFNYGKSTLDINQLQLKYGNVGFSLHDSTGGALDLSPLPAGGRRIIQIQFIDPNSQKQVDSIIFGAPCDPQSVALIGSDGANDFMVTNQTWPNELLGHSYPKSVLISNLSAKAIIIDSANLGDPHFTLVPGEFPFVLQVKPSITINVIYTPDAGSLIAPNRTQGNWYSHDVLESNGVTPSVRHDSLVGWVIAPSTSFGDDTTITIDCASDSTIQTVALTLTATGTTASTINRVYQSDTADFLPLQGMLANGTTWNPDSSSQQIPAGQTAWIIVRCHVGFRQNATLTDYLNAIDANGDTIGGGPVSVTMIVNNWNYSVSNSSLIFGPVAFQGPPVTQTFTINNTAQSVLEINGIVLVPSKYDSAFTITTVPPVSNFDTLQLQPGQSLTVTVTFNDSISDDPVQSALLDIASNNACSFEEISIEGLIGNSGVAETTTPPLGATVIPSEDGRSLEIILPVNLTAPTHFELVNVLGQSVLGATLGTQTQTMDVSTLPRGVYFYRITSGSMNQMGKVILGE